MIALLLLLLSLLSTTLAAQDPGAEALRSGRYGEAEQIYRRMLKESPENPHLHMNLGLALHSGRKYKEAVREFEWYLRAQPQPGPVHLLLGAARLKLNQPCEAIAPLERARTWQANEQTLVELGDAYQGCKRYADAARTYQRAAKLKPSDSVLARAAARCFWQAREYAEARALYASLKANDAEFLYEYGDTLSRVDGAEAGLPLLKQAVEAAPDLIPAHGALGRVLMELGHAAESIPHLEAAAPTDGTLLLPLSRAYKAAGRASDAARMEAEYRRRVGSQN
jgi:tetratricopeptide (TPR) repeat protein